MGMKSPPDLAAKCLAMADPVAAPKLPDDISEKDFQARVIALAKERHWLCYHTYSSKRSEPGFPDLVLARIDSLAKIGQPENGRVIFAELKRSDGDLNKEQVIWGSLLLQIKGTVEYYLWKPEDWERIKEILK